MNQKQEVHKWTTKSEYYDMEDGTEISKQKAIRDYNIIKKHITYKIENGTGTKTIINECDKKKQLRIW